MKPIIVTGFPYVFPYHFRVFEFLAAKEDFVFLLPKFWRAKGGKIKIILGERRNFTIYALNAWSYGGRSFLKGTFKGWMPSIILWLPYLRLRFKSKVLYSCSEPNLLTTLYCGLCAKIFGLKHIIFTWQNLPPEARMTGLKLFLSNTLVKINLSLADGVICGNKKAERIIRQFSRNIVTFVCPLSGVDVERFQPVTTKESEKEKTILFCGALDKRKGVDDLIKAMFLVLKECQAKLVLVGTGPEREALIELAKELNLEKNVELIDWVPNEKLPKIMQNAYVFVYPSVPYDGWEEQFGYSMAEAGACAVPVVSTKTGSIDEVVVDGKSGILVSPNKPSELASAILEILNNKQKRKAMGFYARKYIVKNYSHAVVAQKISDFLYNYVS